MTFTEREMKLVSRLKDSPPQTVLKISQPCPVHSYCDPLPLFRLYKIDDASFEAEWNSYHEVGTRQQFRFSDV
jgi:hypothetical protein